MSAETITPVGFDLSPTPADATASDINGGGAGRGGSQNGSGSPLVVVQQPRGATPPRPAPSRNQGNTGNSLRNGYAAISHSVSGETAAIGLGFLLAGPAGAVAGGAALPVVVAASVWRARRREHDANANNRSNGTNGTGTNSGSGRDRSGTGSSGSGGGRGNGGGRHRSPNGSDGGRHKTPKGPKTSNGNGSGGGTNRKPKVKDPVADKLGKAGKGFTDKLKNRNKTDKTPKNGKHDGASGGSGKSSGTDPNGTTGKDPKTPKNGKGRKWLKDRGPQPDSPKPWDGRGDKPKKNRKKKSSDNDDTLATTARDGLELEKPKNNDGASADEPEIVDAELVDDLPPKPDRAPDDVIDGEVIEDRIALVQARREKAARRAAIRVGKKAAADAARDGTAGDPHTVQRERIRTENQWIDRELHHEAQLLALVADTEQRRNSPVSYPVATSQPAGTSTPGVAVARQIDVRGSDAYRILLAMAEQLANGLHNDEDADMADHVVELVGIPTMCRNLATAVRQGAAALQKTAPLHPSVIKHLNGAAVAALTAARMADTIIVVFVQAHREDIHRVMESRVGEDRWNIRNAAGTLDGAKLRAAIMAAGQQRLALPAGSSTGPTGGGSGKLVPASHDSTKKLINLMKGFDRGHMVDCLSEVAGSARGVEVVADSVTKLYHRMAKTWPTEQVVDDTVRVTASKVKTVADELRKAIKAAQRAHQRELHLNAKPRKGAAAEKKWDVVKGRRG
ncbi:hypothetical protein ACFV27_37220 [Streptomyces antimycoticus]|uniref:hypothetical protein n=1 Tax=Streptomyces antimycoticus TaxID=68175 RepID=UPI0036979CED